MLSGTAFSYLESVSISRVVFIGDSVRSNPRLWSYDEQAGSNSTCLVCPTVHVDWSPSKLPVTPVNQDFGPRSFSPRTEIDILFGKMNRFVFIVTVVLFLLPCSLLLEAWRHYIRNTVETPTHGWRIFCGKAALILAICSMLLELV